MDRSSTDSKEVDLNNTVDQMALRDIYRTCYLTTAEHIFFSSSHGAYSRIDYMLGHKTILSRFKMIEISNRKNTEKFTNTQILNTRRY